MVFRFKTMLNHVIDMIYPRTVNCLACNMVCNTYNRYGFCPLCFESLPFIEDPFCSICGRQCDEGQVCSICRDIEHIFTQGVSVFEYDSPISDMIHRFKYRGETGLAEPMAMFMAEAIVDRGWEFSSIVPVPLHSKRLYLRGYNQAYYLANSMAKLLGGVEVLDTALIRKRNTPSQIGMDRDERMWNLYDAFEVGDKSLVEGKTILLVDDVLTTGSTADNCSSALLNAGAEDVYLSTFAASIFHNI